MMENSPSEAFFGVRFVLVGFNAIDEGKVRSKLVGGGGIDVGRYSHNCTHVIVDEITYDHPICEAARKDGKILVTGLWVDHSLETGMVADASSVIYRPLKDLNGIPGAESLIVCLTGYQRQDREDIMTMVAMMGGQFSKPLVANKVTHLICYKFEGEKYDLAKRLRRIKLVNHRWLEDCLKDWKLLPEAEYNKSGHELEMMEALAKDSEDEAEGASMKQSGRQLNSSQLGLRGGISDAAGMPGIADLEAPPVQPTASMIEDLPNLASESTWVTPGKVNRPYKPPSFGALPDPLERALESESITHAVGSISRSAGSHSLSAGKGVTPLSYSRTPRGSSDMNFEDISVKRNSPTNMGLVGGAKSYPSPVSKGKHAVEEIESVNVEASCKTAELQNEVTPRQLAQSRPISGSVPNSKAQKADNICPTRVAQSSSSNYQLLEKQTAFLGGTTTNFVSNIGDWRDHGTHLRKSLESLSETEPPSSSKTPVASDIRISRNLNPKVAQNEMADENMSKMASNDLATEKSYAVMNLDSFQGSKDKSLSVQSSKERVGKKTLGSKNRLKSTANRKGSVFSSKMTSNDEFTGASGGGQGEKLDDSAKKMEISYSTDGLKKGQEMVKQFGSEIDDARIDRFNDETESLVEKDDYDFDKLMNGDNLKEAELAHDAVTEMEAKLGDKDVNGDSKEQKTNDAAGFIDVLSENKDNQMVSSGMLSPAKGRKRKSGVAGVETASVKKIDASKSKKEMKLKEKENCSEARKMSKKQVRANQSKDQEDSSQEKEHNRQDSSGGQRSSLEKAVNRDNLKEAEMAHDAGKDKKASYGDKDVNFDSKEEKTVDAAGLVDVQSENKDNQKVSAGRSDPAKGRKRKSSVSGVETSSAKKTKASKSKKEMKQIEQEAEMAHDEGTGMKTKLGDKDVNFDSNEDKTNNAAGLADVRSESKGNQMVSAVTLSPAKGRKGESGIAGVETASAKKTKASKSKKAMKLKEQEAEMAHDAGTDMKAKLGDKDVNFDSNEDKTNNAAGLADVRSENNDNHMVSAATLSPAKGRQNKSGVVGVETASVKKTKASKSKKEMKLKEREAEMGHDAGTEIKAKSGDKDVNFDSNEDKKNDAAGLADVRSENKDNQMVSAATLSPVKGRKSKCGVAGDETASVKKTKASKSKKEMKLKKMEDVSEARSSEKKKHVRAGKSKDQEDLSKEKENNSRASGICQHSTLEKPANKAAVSTKTATAMKLKKIKAEPLVGLRGLSDDKEEPKWFIFKGERKQRKEYQKIIKRLKGRCCRDLHQWSYQATHFITAELRRTEKFFAAAASGRWILKSDYVTASDQAGKLLREEPFEWYEKRLGENGAINLEAPRKWRHLREKTGHGAFYGMYIVVYGDSFVPPLETLKRVVKAGDGTILATSPPYTRFLDSDIHFAVVSPETPRGDIWVQEFLKHEIPCVVADYLVEYVCKPGYELDKHVLYGMQPLAKRSLSKLQKLINEVADDYILRDDSSDADDIACEVCGSRARGEVMLICGDENGSTGCGIGTHIDCCDPPLHEVPDNDWYCSKCRESMNS